MAFLRLVNSKSGSTELVNPDAIVRVMIKKGVPNSSLLVQLTDVPEGVLYLPVSSLGSVNSEISDDLMLPCFADYLESVARWTSKDLANERDSNSSH